MKRKRAIVTALLMGVLMWAAVGLPEALAAEGFPYRGEYSDVPVIETEELNAEYADVLIVDVRSKFEYDTIHINKAVNIPIAESRFLEQLESLRAKDGAQKMVFYCNGHTCKKSYKAGQAAMKGGFQNVVAYDAGIFDWVNAHPEKGTFMKQSPVPLDKIATQEKLELKFLSYDEFKQKITERNTVVIDIREPFQREVMPKFPNIQNISADKLIVLLALGNYANKQLLIFDAVGKQVDWLYYHLEFYGYDNYYFLKKGVLSLPKDK